MSATKADNLNVQEICRACLSSKQPLKNLFDVCSPEVFMYCTSVEVSETDLLPRKVCVTCLEILNKFYCFKQVVIRSDAILRKYPKYQETHYEYINDNLKEDFYESIITEEQPYNNGIRHTNEKKNHLKCVKCEKIFHKYENLEAHMRSHFVKKETQYEYTNDNKEDFCEAIVTEEQPYNKRIRRTNKTKKVGRVYKNRLKCVKCDKNFHKYENLEAHMRSHFGKKPDIVCKECGKKFTSINNLNSHMRVHTGIKKYQCPICGKKFAYLNVLKNHERIHAGIKKYICHICNAKFVQGQNLTSHLKLHTGEKLYGCSQCGKKFIQQGNLKVHMIRHTGIKNVACQLCDMRFYVKGDLDKHMRSHSNEKPYSCNICDKTFKSQSFLSVHNRSHTGERPFGCDLCPMKFMSKKDLKHHRMTHTGEKPHKCQLCIQAFIQKSSLNRHMKSHVKEFSQGQEVQNILIQRPNQLHAVENLTPITVSYAEWQPIT